MPIPPLQFDNQDDAQRLMASLRQFMAMEAYGNQEYIGAHVAAKVPLWGGLNFTAGAEVGSPVQKWGDWLSQGRLPVTSQDAGVGYSRGNFSAEASRTRTPGYNDPYYRMSLNYRY